MKITKDLEPYRTRKTIFHRLDNVLKFVSAYILSRQIIGAERTNERTSQDFVLNVERFVHVCSIMIIT